MATNPSTLSENSGRIEAPDADYTYGSAQDDTTGTTGDGTPIKKAILNDTYGLQQALLRAAAIVPSGNADTQLVSQYLQGVIEQAAGRAFNYDEEGTSAADEYVIDLRTNQQGPASLFDGQILKFTTAFAGTGGATTIDVSLILGESLGTTIKSVKLKGGADPSAGDITDDFSSVYDSGNDWFELNTSGLTDADKVDLKSGRKNTIINGDFDIWQREITQTSSGYGSDDRWVNGNSGTTKVHTQQSFSIGQTDVPNSPRFYSRTVVTSGVSPAFSCQKQQKIENVRNFSGQTLSLSFWAKADSSKNIATEFVQGFGSGGSPSSVVTAIGVTTHSLTTVWQKFTATIAIPSISGKTLGTDDNSNLELFFWFDAGSNLNARTNSLGSQSGTFDIAQVQIEHSSFATDFELRTLSEEILLCQYFFSKSYDLTTLPGTVTNNGELRKGYSRIANAVVDGSTFPVRMRSVPSVTLYSEAAGTIDNVTNSGDKAAVITFVGETNISRIDITGAAVGVIVSFHYTADSEL